MGGKKKKQIKQPDVTLPNGDASLGKAVFEENCGACHALAGDDKNSAGPRLGGVIGRQTGSTNFPASKALKGAGFNWSEKHLFVYLLNPGKYIPGNKMSFAGLAGEQDRANLIAFLKENS